MRVGAKVWVGLDESRNCVTSNDGINHFDAYFRVKLIKLKLDNIFFVPIIIGKVLMAGSASRGSLDYRIRTL